MNRRGRTCRMSNRSRGRGLWCVPWHNEGNAGLHCGPAVLVPRGRPVSVGSEAEWSHRLSGWACVYDVIWWYHDSAENLTSPMPPQLPFYIIQPLRIPDIWVVEPTALLVAGHRGWRSCPKSMLMDGEGRVGAADVRLVSAWIWSQWWVWEAERWWLALGVVGRTHIHTHTQTHTLLPRPRPRELCEWSLILESDTSVFEPHFSPL